MRSKITSIGLTAAVLLVTAATVSFASQQVIYVDDDADAPGDGCSWKTAFRFLQDALADAELRGTPVEIRVAQGIYRPDQGAGLQAGDRDATFRMLNGVTIRGGFGGLGRPDPNGRDVNLYETILSGDLAGNDIDGNNPCDLLNEPTRAENSYHVLTALYTSETAVVDGLTITGGNANYSQYRRSRGGALWCWFATPTVKNCVIRRNSAIDYGGGISECGKVEDCLVTQNYARGSGGGLFRCGPVCCCVVTHNFAGVRGGGVSGCESLVDCIVSHNSAKSIGGGIEGSDSRIIGCAIVANDAAMGGGIADCNMVGGCLIVGNQADKGAGLYNCSILANSTIASNRANKLGGGIYQENRKATVNNSIFWANTAAQGDQAALSASCWATNCGPDCPVEFYCYYGSISFRHSDVESGAAGIYRDWEECEIEWTEGNLEADPCFAEPGYWEPNGASADSSDDSFVEGDYHLKSQAGRWDPNSESWDKDDVTSPCIDTGDPNSPVDDEPEPNGSRINMGAYGGTAEASKSYLGEPVSKAVVGGDINNGDCRVD